MALFLFSVIIALIIVGILFINLSPQFGGKHRVEDIERYEASGHYSGGKFVNLIPTNMDMSMSNMWNIIKEYMKGIPNAKPKTELPLQKADSITLANLEEPTLMWFGHSAFFLKLDDKNILIDPMLGESPSPHPLLGTKRFNKNLPIDIEQLPPIDLILISHDHYDHLDYGSIIQLKEQAKEFFVPLGVGAHLRKWGIEENRITEFNWWQEATFEGIKLAFAPARHFSGRGIADNSSTMWGSWVIQGKTKNIYFSGDSGYGPHFKEIGVKYGPFDFAMMECGQYNEKWANIHMMPEETAQAAEDVKAKRMMPIHWGAFTLALHSWNDPVIRVSKKANEINMPILIPEIGSLIRLSGEFPEVSDWWKQ